MNIKNVNILFCGAFRPVHFGHINIIHYWLTSRINGYVPTIHVIISKNDRDGISAQSSYDFLKGIFGKYPNFDCIISEDKSPIYTAYTLTADKAYGDGLYALVSSTKNGDDKRSDTFVSSFATGGRYETSGVTPMAVKPMVDNVIYSTRTDDKNGLYVSSRIIREDVINDDFENFVSAYGNVNNIDSLRRYYDVLRTEIVPGQIEEGGAFGHMLHMFEGDDLKFKEMKEIINKLFSVDKTDLVAQEKLDGLNIYASMDKNGRVVYARNKSHLRYTPLTREDIIRNETWTKEVKAAFAKATDIIEDVFSNITGKMKFFYQDDAMDGLYYQNWCNIEIIDTDCPNVIPYTESFVSFNGIETICYSVVDDDNVSKFSRFEDPNLETDMKQIELAVQRTNKKYERSGISAKVNPQIIFAKVENIESKRDEFITRLDELMEDAEVNDNSTLREYKRNVVLNHIMHQKWSTKYNDKDLLDIAWYLVGERKRLGSILRSFIGDKKKSIVKRAMNPMTKLVTDIGNDVVSMCTNLQNKNEQSIAAKGNIKAAIEKKISAVENAGNKDLVDKLEILMTKLGSYSNIPSSEGVVVVMNVGEGSERRKVAYKFTGNFMIINQILNLK